MIIAKLSRLKWHLFNTSSQVESLSMFHPRGSTKVSLELSKFIIPTHSTHFLFILYILIDHTHIADTHGFLLINLHGHGPLLDFLLKLLKSVWNWLCQSRLLVWPPVRQWRKFWYFPWIDFSHSFPSSQFSFQCIEKVTEPGKRLTHKNISLFVSKTGVFDYLKIASLDIANFA